MAQPDAVSIESIRRLAAARARQTSVNRVAGEIGLTARGLQLFLHGSAPYAPSRSKLLKWYVREISRDTSGVETETIRAALEVLMHGLAPARREDVQRRAVAWWAKTYADEGVVPLPAWLEELGGPRDGE